MTDQCIACRRSLKPFQRRTLRSSEAAITFLSGFGRIPESTIRSSIRHSKAYMCKPCLKRLEDGNATVQQLDTVLNGCRSHFRLPVISINAIEIPVEAEDSEEGNLQYVQCI